MATKIVSVKPADDNHQVVTVTGGQGLFRREPCGGCPWRCDNAGEFPAEAFRHSASTAYDRATNMFACHESGTEKPATCAGFLMRGADHNLSVRLKYASKDFDFNAISDGGHALHESYKDMAVANGCDADEEVLRRCR